VPTYYLASTAWRAQREEHEAAAAAAAVLAVPAAAAMVYSGACARRGESREPEN
jgi:hypothetical protein